LPLRKTTDSINILRIAVNTNTAAVEKYNFKQPFHKKISFTNQSFTLCFYAGNFIAVKNAGMVDY